MSHDMSAGGGGGFSSRRGRNSEDGGVVDGGDDVCVVCDDGNNDSIELRDSDSTRTPSVGLWEGYLRGTLGTDTTIRRIRHFRDFPTATTTRTGKRFGRVFWGVCIPNGTREQSPAAAMAARAAATNGGFWE